MKGAADTGYALHHVLQRHSLSQCRHRHHAATGTAGLHRGVPRSADLLRPDAFQHGLSAGIHPTGTALHRGLSRRRSHRRSLNVMRRHGARALHKAAALSGDTALIEAVEQLIPRVYELSEFLVKRLNVTDVGAYYPHRVTYHSTCHSLRVLHVDDTPLQLLRTIKGIDLVELPNARECCGFGGTFAIKNADTSLAMLSDKMRCVLNTGAEVLWNRQ